MHSTIFVTFQRLSQCQDLSVSTTFWPSSCSLHQVNDNKQTHTHMYPQTHITSGVFMQNSGGNETVVIHLCGQERKSHPYRPKNIGEKHALSMSKERGGQGTLTTQCLASVLQQSPVTSWAFKRILKQKGGAQTDIGFH